MANFRKNTVIFLSVAAVLMAIVGVYSAIHSSLFTVQVVEVTDQVSSGQAMAIEASQKAPPWTPVDPQVISDLAAVPIGQANLFDLDLRGVEKRILSNEWIRDVHLQKRFPQTLSISTVFRDPKAVIQLETGVLAYVDTSGKVFGQINLAGPKNLPLITNVDSENTDSLQGLLKLLSQWESKPISKFARIESMDQETEKGYRLMVSYKSGPDLIHARVEMGHELSDEQFTHLGQVFEYLHTHNIVARQIFADAGKKIVVKTAHGS